MENVFATKWNTEDSVPIKIAGKVVVKMDHVMESIKNVSVIQDSLDTHAKIKTMKMQELKKNKRSMNTKSPISSTIECVPIGVLALETVIW